MSIDETIKAAGGVWNATLQSGQMFCPVCQSAPDDESKPALSIMVRGETAPLLYCHKDKCDYHLIFHELVFNLPARQVLAPPAAPYQTSEQKLEKARQIWANTLPISGTPAERYLRNRGLKQVLPDMLRYDPGLWHGPSRQRACALVARIEPTGAIHRIYITPNGRKLVLDHTAKLSLGPTKGGAVRLKTGTGILIIAEGIETALSVELLYPNFPDPSIWASLGTGGMASLELPELPSELIIAADGGRAGEAAAFSLADRASKLGWRVQIIHPPAEMDFNDVLMGRANDDK